MIRQARLMGLLDSWQTEKGESAEEKCQEHAHHCDMKDISFKEFVLPGQTVNSAYYCDDLRRLIKNVRRLRPELCDKITGCCITTTHRLTLPFSIREIFI
jgi:hypothetical protein